MHQHRKDRVKVVVTAWGSSTRYPGSEFPKILWGRQTFLVCVHVHSTVVRPFCTIGTKGNTKWNLYDLVIMAQVPPKMVVGASTQHCICCENFFLRVGLKQTYLSSKIVIINSNLLSSEIKCTENRKITSIKTKTNHMILVNTSSGNQARSQKIYQGGKQQPSFNI